MSEVARTGPPQVLPPDEHNRELVSQVHPPGWRNPTPSGRYNLVVIGAGTAGLVSAAGAAGLGAKVALIERHLLGGDCLNYGCVPSKALLRCARAAAEVRRAGEFGVRVGGPVEVDFAAVMERMRRLRAGIGHHDSAERFRGLGVDVFLGEARFTSPETVTVGGQTLRFARAVIATGARAASLDLPGLGRGDYLTNETVFSLTELPRRLAVIGAGPIGCEQGQAFRRFGSEVHLINRSDRLLGKEEPPAVAVVRRQLEREGIVLHLGARPVRVERHGAETLLILDKGGQQGTVAADAILLAVGRQPNVEGLGLEQAGVEYDRSGVKVDDYLRTSNRRIYAAGDICSRFKFTHAADAMARIVLRNALFFGRSRASDLVIPWCTYTDPEVAHVGLTAEEAGKQGVTVRTFRLSLAEVDRAVLDGDTEGFALVHVCARRVVGATVVAAHAGEMIGEVVLAMTKRLGLAALSATIHPYPTEAEVFRKLADAQQKTRLTPWLAWLFRTVLGWRR
jgi:pyruvate/2-oxoglutarate dehydrogenase complex dihydrolipoamide dehydrogenase (E3) component